MLRPRLEVQKDLNRVDFRKTIGENIISADDITRTWLLESRACPYLSDEECLENALIWGSVLGDSYL